jgi:hypothetical protein
MKTKTLSRLLVVFFLALLTGMLSSRPARATACGVCVSACLQEYRQCILWGMDGCEEVNSACESSCPC